MLSATGAFDGCDGRRTTSAILILRSRFAPALASRRLPLSRAPLRNCDAAHVNVPLVNGLPSANSVADCPLRPHSSIRSAQTASVLGFIPAKMKTIHALVKNGAHASDTDPARFREGIKQLLRTLNNAFDAKTQSKLTRSEAMGMSRSLLI